MCIRDSNNPDPENAAEIVNNNGKWNDRNANDTQDSYIEYEGSVTSLGDLIYLGEYSGHSYFRNTQDLNWSDAKQAAENLGGYLASIHTIEESSAITNFGFFRGWIGLYQDSADPGFSESDGGWRWVDEYSNGVRIVPSTFSGSSTLASINTIVDDGVINHKTEGYKWVVEIRNRTMKCIIVKPPFYKNGSLLS